MKNGFVVERCSLLCPIGELGTEDDLQPMTNGLMTEGEDGGRARTEGG